ncbi:MAG: hypothetical protein ACREGB_04145 [Candidatus Saccharimonadales bacterium]
MSREVLGREIIRAARKHIGKSALWHWKFAGNCLDPEVEGLCFSNGLGPRAFDCSGLIANVVSSVQGKSVSEWPSEQRHVRDMWAAGGVALDNLATVVPGDILVQALLKDGQVIRPAHIGIVVEARPEETLWLHASPGAGEVVISPVPDSSKILGRYAVNS